MVYSTIICKKRGKEIICIQNVKIFIEYEYVMVQRSLGMAQGNKSFYYFIILRHKHRLDSVERLHQFHSFLKP